MNYQQATQILSLSSSLTVVKLKKAFRAYALVHHPDKNPDDSTADERFRQGLAAYQYLLDHQSEWPQTTTPDQSPSHDIQVEPDAVASDDDGETVENLEDIFDDIFGFTRQDRVLGFQTPEDLNLSFSELAFGLTKTVRLTSYLKCSTCDGGGAQPPAQAHLCTYCFGSGRIWIEQPDDSVDKLCPKCQGCGRTSQKPCASCLGFGRQATHNKQTLTIPQGLKPNQIYTLKAHESTTQQELDVFARVRLMPSDVFGVDKSDVLCEYPVSQSQAKIGGVIKVPGLWGWLEVTLKPGVVSGEQHQIPGGGLRLNPGSDQKGLLVLTLKVCEDNDYQKQFRDFFNQISKNNPIYGKRKPWWQKLLGR